MNFNRRPRLSCTVALATFMLLLSVIHAGPSWAAQGYAITTIVESGQGKIKPASTTARSGKSKMLTIKPAKGWHVATIKLNGATTVYNKDNAVVLGSVKVKGKAVKYRLRNVTADQTVTASFEQDRTFSLTLSVEGNGTVKVRPGGLNCSAASESCTATYAEDKQVKLKAKPAGGYLFTGWSGSASGIRRHGKIVMNADKTVTARFESRSAAAAALKVAEKISVVDAKDNASLGATVGASVPVDSDYEQDETFVYVEENSIEAFDMINEILCWATQTKYDAMLNKGPYKALIDQNQCDTNKDNASSADDSSSQSSAASMPDYMQWTVESVRRDNASPHVVEAWIQDEGDDSPEDWEPAMRIFSKFVITESASETNPYGLFTMNFAAYPVGLDKSMHAGVVTAQGVGDEPMFKGYLKAERDASGSVLLKFVSADADWVPGEFVQKATLSRNDAGGRGSTSIHEAWGQEVENARYDIAFTDDNFLRDDGTNQLCLDRNNFEETAWRYGLYDSETGSRISPRSGFPVKVTRDGKEYYGWIGYWGMWLPDDLSLESGDTVYRQQFDADPIPYELFIAQGKLRKHTKKVLTLGGIKNVPLEWWNEPNNTNYRLVWDGTGFKKIALFNEDTGIWDELKPAEAMALTDLPYDTLFLWSQALGGQVRVKLQCTSDDPPQGTDYWEPTFACSADDSATVVIYEESIVYPSDDVPANLACFTQCPNGANDDSENLYFDDSQLGYQDTAPAGASYIAYTFDKDSMLLTYDSGSGSPTEIIQTVENDSEPWGVNSGPLFEPTSANLAKLTCDWDDRQSSTCGWQAWDKLDEYYTWESGPNEWNTFTALRNSSGVLERFEPPLSVQYTHHQADTTAADYKYDGTTFYLEYNGFGDLYGIPGRCVDMETGEDVSCDEDTRWIPALTIPDGAELEGDAKTYLAKALEKEQRMRNVDTSNCESLDLVSYDLPSVRDWKAPNIGKEPVVDGPPAVVGGVLQE